METKKAINSSSNNKKSTNNQIEKQTLENQYLKLNPLIIKSMDNSKTKISKSFEWFKIFFAIAMIVFGLIALWFTTQWKINTLSNLGILKNELDFSQFLDLDPGKYWTPPPQDELTNQKDILNNLNKVLTVSMLDWNINKIYTSQLHNLLITMSFVGIISTIPLLVFKRGTIFSLISLFIVFVSLVIVISVFSIGFSVSREIVQSNEIKTKVDTIETLYKALLKPEFGKDPSGVTEGEKIINDHFIDTNKAIFQKIIEILKTI